MGTEEIKKWEAETIYDRMEHGQAVPSVLVSEAVYTRDISRLTRLNEARQEYIKLLGEEIGDLIGFHIAHFPGWSSPRHEAGKDLREKIAAIEQEGEHGTP
jgi:hypothetical protein